ncbi:MAG TPA: hypothetical protein VK815_16955 [Candidatus Acidoferrales bacterium]|jgi:hypothetical protein|nr:hypothetical protein [Candidatus Acidoferrales bacterium]
MTSPAPKTDSPKVFAAWLAALFLVVLGAKLWIVQLYGSPLPLWDQWYEAKDFFRPWMEGSLTWRDFFAPSNEHRIFFTHLLDYTVISLNGRWEPMLQMTVNCFIHAGFACALATALWVFLGRQNGWLICGLLAPFYALPYAAENTLWAINSQQYFMSLAALGTIAGLGFGRPGSPRWWLGLAAAFAGLVTMGSGFLAAMTVGGLMVLRLLKNRRMERGNLVTLALCIVVVALGASLNVSMPADQPLRAHTMGEFFAAFARNLAWPFIENPKLMCLVTLLPLVVLLAFYFCKNFTESRAAEFILVLALWSGLQSAAIAFGRANYGDGFPASRYMDVLNILIIAGIFAVLLLQRQWVPAGPGKQIAPLLPLIFAGVMLLCIVKISQLVVDQLLVQTRLMNLIAEERVETFMATGDEKELFAAPTVRPEPKVILAILENKKLRPILPGICQPPDQRPPPYRFMMPTELLLQYAPVILGAGLALFTVLCGVGLARGALGLTRENLSGVIVLLAVLMALGFVWSRSPNTRRAVEFALQRQLAESFQASNNPQRAAIHAAKAEALKAEGGRPGP